MSLLPATPIYNLRESPLVIVISWGWEVIIGNPKEVVILPSAKALSPNLSLETRRQLYFFRVSRFETVQNLSGPAYLKTLFPDSVFKVK